MGLPVELTGRGAAVPRSPSGAIGPAGGTGAVVTEAAGEAATGGGAKVAWGAPVGAPTDGLVGCGEPAGRPAAGAACGRAMPGALVGRGALGGGGIGGRGAEVRGASRTSLADLLTTRR
jgi:hypothetical protein